LFNMNIKNTVLTKRIMDDEFERLNGGSSLHQGIELEYKWLLSSGKLSIEGAYTFGDYTFDEFVDAGIDYSGHQLPGTPLHRLYTQLNLSPWAKWDFHMDHHWVADVYLNDANTVSGDGYQLVNAGMTYTVGSGLRWSGSVSLNVHNVFDIHYSSMFQINAPGAQPRYYYPGKPRSIYLNLAFTHKI
jgi:iron complex outermembrane recepter protein